MKYTRQQCKAEILKIINLQYGITTGEIIHRMNMTHSTIKAYLLELVREGELIRTGATNKWHYHIRTDEDVMFIPDKKIAARLDVVTDYKANSKVYWLDKLLRQARANI